MTNVVCGGTRIGPLVMPVNVTPPTANDMTADEFASWLFAGGSDN